MLLFTVFHSVWYLKMCLSDIFHEEELLDFDIFWANASNPRSLLFCLVHDKRLATALSFPTFSMLFIYAYRFFPFGIATGFTSDNCTLLKEGFTGCFPFLPSGFDNPQFCKFNVDLIVLFTQGVKHNIEV